jgi:hypothetical protein
MDLPLPRPKPTGSIATCHNSRHHRGLSYACHCQMRSRGFSAGNQQRATIARGRDFSRPDRSLYPRGDRARRPRAHYEGAGSQSHKQTHLAEMGSMLAAGRKALSSSGVAAESRSRSKDQRPYSRTHVSPIRESHALGVDSIRTQSHGLGRTERREQAPKTASDPYCRRVCIATQPTAPTIPLNGASRRMYRASHQRNPGLEVDFNRFRAPSHGSQGRVRSKPNDATEVRSLARPTPLDPDVATVLLQWKRLCPETKEAWVFPSPRTNKPYDSSSLRKKTLKPAAKRAQIKESIGWHTLRHSYRAWLDETGAPLGVQQKLMRHANISTTMNVYGGALMEAKRQANTSVVRRVLTKNESN